MWAFLLWSFMSDRITNQWTPTLAEAFGNNENVQLGRQGELDVLEEINSWGGYSTIDHEADFALQKAGIDISLKKHNWARYFTVDVKTGTSYQDDYGTIKIDMNLDGWFLSKEKTSDRIWHVNPNTGWMTWYDRKDMKKYIAYLDNITLNKYNQFEIKRTVTELFIHRGRLKKYEHI